MGLLTQDPELYKIVKFRANWTNIEQDTAIQENLLRNLWIAGHLPRRLLYTFSKIQLVVFYQCCVLIG